MHRQLSGKQYNGELWVVGICDYICFSVFSKFQQCTCNTTSVIILQATKGSFKSNLSIYEVPTIGETQRSAFILTKASKFFSVNPSPQASGLSNSRF